ncbi:hypothetical protein [Streptomyces sp. NPDC058092]|uniref:hypothetical protein n=1 Tax=Streptomyces sp. NPDC058092 TaxID=3346336 RepID=UPI0036F173E6
MRFYLAYDRRGCQAWAVFDLVVAEPPPDVETDLFGHVLYRATVASPYVEELGRIFIQQEGYWCPNCASPGRRSRDVTSS